MSDRDDFSESTKRTMRGLVNNRCSYPGCRTATVGPTADGTGVQLNGTAAHITAAAEGGKRYDRNMTPEERKHVSNGMWCCPTHGRLIDTDENLYRVDTLRSWKKAAEDRAFRELVVPNARPELSAAGEELTDDEQSQIALLGLGQPQDIFLNAIECSKRDLAAFKRQLGWASNPVLLDLKLKSTDDGSYFDANGLAVAMQACGDVIVRAAPGTGKTTTLIQVVDAVLTEGTRTAAYIGLSEWSSLQESFLQNLLRRHAFQNLSPQHFHYLAIHGRLVLVLDGWNELDFASRQRAAAQINELRRDFPRLTFLISTRRQAVDVPMKGREVEIAPVTRAKQLEFAAALGIQSPEKILQQAWRTSGVRALVAIPLYLTAFLRTSKADSMPTTKEEVLRRFVEEHEQKPERKEVLRQRLSDRHQEFLVSLAVHANNTANTYILEDAAYKVLASATKVLAENGLITITNEFQPMNIVDVLVDQHSLVRPDATMRSVMFQHQQIQEWYASHKVENVMRAAAGGEKEAATKIREILNQLSWEESVLFACERMSRADKAGVEAVAKSIVEALGIDPMLAALMIRHSGEQAWPLISERVIKFATKWYAGEQRDAAFKFMIGIGRAELADLVWQAIGDEELDNLRGGLPPGWIALNSLGSDARDRLAALPPGSRQSLLWDVVHYGGWEGIDFAVAALNGESEPTVVNFIAEQLYHGGADEAFNSVLANMSKEAWSLFAGRIAIRDTSGELRDRVIAEQRRLAEAETDGSQKLRYLLQLHQAGQFDDIPALMSLALDSRHRDFQAERYVFDEVSAIDPAQFSRFVMERLLSGQELPNTVGRNVVTVAPEANQAALRQIATTDVPQAARGKILAARMLNQNSGSMLIGELFELQGTRDRAQLDRRALVTDALHAMPCDQLVDAILATPTADPDQIGELCALISRWRDPDRNANLLPISEEQCDRLIERMHQWTNSIIGHAQGKRFRLAEVAGAVRSIAYPQLLNDLRRLLDDDIRLWLEERAARTRVDHGYTAIYRQAFAALDGDGVRDVLLTYIGNPMFEVEAAFELIRFDSNRADSPYEALGRLKYEKIPVARARRAQGLRPLSEVAAHVLDRIDALVADGQPEALGRATEMANAALQMNYGNRIGTVSSVLGAPGEVMLRGPGGGRYGLMTVMAFQGEPISADIVKTNFDNSLAGILNEQWRAHENWYLAGRWLELLAFTDRPNLILDCLAATPEALRQRAHNFDRLFNALGYGEPQSSLTVLVEIEAQYPETTSNNEFFSAFVKIGTEAAARELMNIAFSGRFNGRPLHHASDLSKPLEVLLMKHPNVKREFVEQAKDRAKVQASPVLLDVMSSVLEPDDVVPLIAGLKAHGGDAISQALHKAVQNLGAAIIPVSEGANIYTHEPTDLTSLRSALFKVYLEGGEAAAFAKTLINLIASLREAFGRVLSEPRHPNIEAGVPWPPIKID